MGEYEEEWQESLRSMPGYARLSALNYQVLYPMRDGTTILVRQRRDVSFPAFEWEAGQFDPYYRGWKVVGGVYYSTPGLAFRRAMAQVRKRKQLARLERGPISTAASSPRRN
jgi:hypothetical protein